ncbi:MAG: tetratricopeptide repeat protein [Myxococcota bacterium]
MRRVSAAPLPWLLLLVVAPVASAAPSNPVERAHQALLELQVEDAKRLVASAPEGPDRSYVQALVHFHEADYPAALRALERSIADAPLSDDDDRRSLRDLLSATHEATENFTEARSSDGRFVVRYAPGPDAVLAPYALVAMGAADEALTAELGLEVPGPIVLEIYPTPSSLAQVSTLSVEAIQRTGTIALCKWDRLMITSPRALVRGYPWMDTIAHEYVHLVLSRASRDQAPVWFQEGTAKFLERTWRGESPRAHLEPAAAGLLRKAAKQGSLIPFKRLHPSIALLPSQQDAALAFAQVATFIESFHEAEDAEGLQQAIGLMAEGTDARRALAEVGGVSFGSLENRWKKTIAQEVDAPEDPPPVKGLRFRKGEAMDESLEVEEERARRFVRLGDLLWDGGRPEAAEVEYAKAHTAAPDDPVVASRLARAALAAGHPDQALDAIASVVERYPDHAPAHVVMGSALLAQGNKTAAAHASREALRLNPFDPQPHCDLAMATDHAAERRRERSFCEQLGEPEVP